MFQSETFLSGLHLVKFSVCLSISRKTKLGPLFSTGRYKIHETQARFETVQIASLINYSCQIVTSVNKFTKAKASTCKKCKTFLCSILCVHVDVAVSSENEAAAMLRE